MAVSDVVTEEMLQLARQLETPELPPCDLTWVSGLTKLAIPPGGKIEIAALLIASVRRERRLRAIAR